jgi:WD40 repeat protein
MEDADTFHGRERLVNTLVSALVDHAIVVVSGSSGAGKSSVVRAGLIPAIGAGAIPGSDAWAPLVVVPGARATDALASLTAEDAPEAPVLLVCDQLEQLWSSETEPAERTAFLDAVIGLVQDDVVARCVLSIRGDHLGRLGEQPGLAERMLGGLVMVPNMTELELRQVVQGPAEGVGLTVEPELTDAAVQDVLGRSGALPLLSVALAQTWVRRRDGVLTLAAYLTSGGVTGAVGRSAEQVFASWSDEERERARRILVRLAEQDQDGTVRTRRVPVAELGPMEGDDALTTGVVDSLVSARLVARDGQHLEVAHEALLTAWPRLSGWLADDVAGRTVRAHLAPAALEWDRHGRPDDELYRGTRLDAAAQWIAAQGSGATDLERVFVEAGLAAARAELTAAEQRAATEAAARRRTRRFAGLLAGALVLALVATGIALLFQQRADDRAAEAREASTVADANRLAALSSTARSLDLSLLLAAAAVDTAETPATLDSLLGSLVEHRRATGVHQLSAEGVEETALSADGRSMATFIDGGSPRVVAWRPGSAQPPSLVVQDAWGPEHIAISPDGGTIVGVNSQPSLRAYTVDGDRLPIQDDLDSLGGYPRDVAYTPDGRLMVFVGDWEGPRVGYRGRLARVDVASGEVDVLASLRPSTRSSDGFVAFEAAFTADAAAVVAWVSDQSRAYRMTVPGGRFVPLRLEPRPATSMEFVATPTGALQLWSDGAVTRYDSRGRAVQVLDVHRARVQDAVVVPGGQAAVTVGDDGQVELWAVDRRTGAWSHTDSLTGHVGAVQQVEVAADGGALLTADRDGQLITWDLTDESSFGTPYTGLPGWWVSHRVRVIDPDRLVVAPARTRGRFPERRTPWGTRLPDTADAAAVFLDPRTGRVVDEVRVGKTAHEAVFGASVEVSPDRRLVAVRTATAVTVLDARTRERVAHVRLPLGKSFSLMGADWSSDGTALLLATIGQNLAHLVVVDTATWQETRRIDVETPAHDYADLFEWSEDGATLLVAMNPQGTIQLFDADLRPQRTLDLGEGGDVWDMSFSPDGAKLAVVRNGGQLAVLDTTTWRPVHEPATMHAGAAVDAEWLPDSNTVVTAGFDEMVSLYDVERDLVRAQPLPASDVRGEGHTFLMPEPTDELVVLSEDGPGRRYPLDPARWLARACTVAGRDLTRAEWDRYLPDRPYRPVCDLSRDQQEGPLP